MALAMNMRILIIVVIFGNIYIGMSGSNEAKEDIKAETFESRRSFGSTNGEIRSDLIPEECKKMGICEKIPVGLEFSDIISRIEKSEKDKYLVNEHQIDHEHRVGDNTLRLCEPINKTVKPFFAIAKDGLWYRIFNSDNENIQSFNGVFCRDEGKPCRTDDVLKYLLDTPPICKQNYIWRKMAYIGKGEKIYHDKKFSIPISCTCKKYLKNY